MAEVRLSQPIKAVPAPKLLDGEWEAGYRFPAGGFAIAEDGKSLWFACPCGCNDVRHIGLSRSESSPYGWSWDGDREAPTLSPSILMHEATPEMGTHWHGFLKKGYWEQA